MRPVVFCAQFSCCVCRRMAVVSLLVQPYLRGGASALHISIHFGTRLDSSDDMGGNHCKAVTKAHKRKQSEDMLPTACHFLGNCFNHREA